ncbi:MAG: DUF4416 family protein [Phycisphaerae bacterium]|nr:DUF4416 family protein [Phycisphaerae bacterium]
MWEIRQPQPVKLIVGILAADQECLQAAVEAVCSEFGESDFVSETFPFNRTDYYKDETGENILRQFVTFKELIDPGKLASIKHRTNQLEEQLAKKIDTALPRPVNLDPGIVELSKLVLASTKNFSHRIYIGENIYAELTLSYINGKWKSFSYTFPDFIDDRYHGFLSKVRERLLEQIRELKD